ncbi:zinc finger HIT domain-containing protein 1 [Trichinella spiralis]|uniref:zinc finger HIT domain-containing protein 1 n=1 Tax=Trichinella spiralis TaxID=6334 RepID=UPI0001EFEED8|nr:zinc finger HIT domain-containing protein 1 [Trichinella spiralis]
MRDASDGIYLALNEMATGRKSSRMQLVQIKEKEKNEKKALEMLKKRIERLEEDNFHVDPHEDLMWDKNLPQFSEGGTPAHPVQNRKKNKRIETLNMRFKKSFDQIIEDDKIHWHPDANYLTAKAPPSRFPSRRFCSVCGLLSKYRCTQCNAYFCTIHCKKVHTETRHVDIKEEWQGWKF